MAKEAKKQKPQLTLNNDGSATISDGISSGTAPTISGALEAYKHAKLETDAFEGAA